MYLPDEDSLLLKESLKYVNKGLCLDLGCGSCFLTEELIKKGCKVVASDIDFDVLAKNKNLSEKVFLINTDLLKPFNRVFDYIFFNPPYLVFDEREGYYLDTTGGKEGYEVSLRFIDQLINALKLNGRAFLILSNYTKNKVTNKINKERMFEIKILKEKHLAFEEIYLAEIKYSELMKKFAGFLEKDKRRKFRFFAKGWNSIILEIVNKDKLAKLHPNSKREYFVLSFIKKKLRIWHLFLPNFELEDNILILQKIKGKSLKEINEKIEKEKKKKRKEKLLKLKYKILVKSLFICYLLDKLKINKYEMNHPEKHILFDGKRVYFIDFEKAKFSEKPKNLTQFVFFINKEIKKDFSIDLKEELIKLTKEYKKNFELRIVKKIKKLIINKLKERFYSFNY